jgi:hypothetical protein
MLDEPLEKLINNSSDASARSRKILLLICFASLIAFFAYHNSRQDSWQVNRYNKIRDVIEKLHAYNYDSLSPGIVEDSLLKSKENEKKDLGEYLSIRRISTNEELRAYEEMFEHIRKDALSISIPILGIKLDINDLALFTGLTLNLFLLIFCFCLEREENSLHHVMNAIFHQSYLIGEFPERGSKKYIQYYFDRLAMSQVLTIPPKPNTAIYTGFFLVSKLPYFAGFASMLLIFLYDLETRGFGTTVNVALTFSDESYSNLLLILMGFLTLLSFTYGVRIDLVWFKHFVKLNEKVMGEHASSAP